MPRKSQIREYVKQLTLFDDVLFQKASEDKKFCEEIVRIFLEDPSLKVLKNETQKTLLNLQGRSVVVDLLCSFSDGRVSLVEVQKTDTEDHVVRVSYEAGVAKSNTTDPGGKFDQVTEIIVIYVMKFDLFKKNDVKYEVKRTLRKCVMS